MTKNLSDNALLTRMSILYKYCDQLGAVKILGSLELKLPYVSDVNDALECLPVIYCRNDFPAKKILLKHKGANWAPSADFEEKFKEYNKSDFQRRFIEKIQQISKEWNKKSLLISVSETAKNSVMWAHYADRHKGAVIGIDFANIFGGMNMRSGIVMDRVEYSEQRPSIDAAIDYESADLRSEYKRVHLTKSRGWFYEQEFRALLADFQMEELREVGVADLKDFNGKKTWFLRLSPSSIKEVIFGLYTEESLELAIRKLIEKPELKHIKLYRTAESAAYSFNLVDVTNR